MARRSRRRPFVVIAAVAALVLLLAACGGNDDRVDQPAAVDGVEATEAGAHVIATTTILADITRNIACEEVAVDTLMSPGQDPHTFELSARHAAELREADLVVANGLGLEESLEDVLLDAQADGTTVVFLGEHVQPIPFTGAEHGDDEHSEEEHVEDEPADEEHAEDEHAGEKHADEKHSEEEPAHGSLDPHVWMDPARMAIASAHLAEELTRATGTDHAECATTYIDSLRQLDSELAALLETIPADKRKLVTNHEALGYLADSYGFEIIGVVIPGGSTTAQPSAADIVQLAETLDRETVSAIFAETTAPTQLADLVASETSTDIEIVSLYTGSLGEPGTEAETYIQMMRTNADRIAAALTK
ncbi:MAG: metal ABC transporter solute-binding protein, Zn/Mn family [Gaiellaceae bacterium]